MPTSLLNCTQLRCIDYTGNPIENIHPLITRFLNRMNNIDNPHYNDTQSVHNHNIHESIRVSILNIFKDKINMSFEEVQEQIIVDDILNKKNKRTINKILWGCYRTFNFIF